VSKWKQAKSPLVVDLDGTLSKTDTLIEVFLLLIKQQMLSLFLLPFWLLKGKAYFKQQMAAAVSVDASGFMYNHDVLAYMKAAKRAGREVYIATGANEKVAQAVANYLPEMGLEIDGLFASSQENLTGRRKQAKLNAVFGEKQYEYVGNASIDLKVWRDCSEAMVVGSASLFKSAQAVCQQTQHMPLEKASFKTYIKAIRVHQWVKNALLFVPLLTAHMWSDAQAISLLLAGFIAFSLAASSVYVLNDLLDLAADRQHHSKCKRPFAAGTIPLEKGVLLFPILLAVAFALALFLPLGFILALSLYYALTVVYSFKLKRVVMLDTVVLAALYTMRIIAGTLLIGVEFSFWLLAFSIFIFLSLALLKRYTELVQMLEDGKTSTAGRGYHASDAPMVSSLGAASGYISVLVMALYIHSPEVADMYRSSDILWLVCPILLYWISRAWLIAHRGLMDDDPIVFAVKDVQSLCTGVFVLCIFVIAALAPNVLM